MLLSMLSVDGVPNTEKLESVTVAERRIVVIEGVGTAIGVLFLLNAGMLVALTLQARLQRSPLSSTGRASMNGIRKRLRICGAIWNVARSELRCRTRCCKIRRHLISTRAVAQSLFPRTSGAAHTTDTISLDGDVVAGHPCCREYMCCNVALQISQTVKLQQALVYEVHRSVVGVTTTLAPYCVILPLIAVDISLEALAWRR